MTEHDSLLRAKACIAHRDYAGARAILRQMPGNITAQRWLVKLDEIAPVNPVIEQLQDWITFWTGLTYAALGCGVVGILASLLFRMQTIQAMQNLAAQGLATYDKTPLLEQAGPGLLLIGALCLGGMLLAQAFVWRCQVGIREEERHQAQLRALQTKS